MTKRNISYFTPPDADPNEAIVGVAYDSGALHEIVLHDGQMRFQITKILRKPDVETIPRPTLPIEFTGQSIGGANNNTTSVAFGNGIFMAIEGYDAYRSVDGINWTYVMSFPVHAMPSVEFLGGIFIIRAYYLLYTTTDGITVTEVDINHPPGELAYHDGTWLAVNEFNWYTASSVVGPWTQYGTFGSYITPPTGLAISATYFAGKWICFTSSGIAYSTDLTQPWQIATPSLTPKSGFVWDTDGTRIIALANSTLEGFGHIISTTDGINWKVEERLTTFTDWGFDLVYHAGYWVLTLGANMVMVYDASVPGPITFKRYSSDVATSSGYWRMRLAAGTPTATSVPTFVLANYSGTSDGFEIGHAFIGQVAAEPDRVELAWSGDGAIPQAYDAATDLLYVWQQLATVSGVNEFYRIGAVIEAIDVRSKTVVRSRKIWSRAAGDTWSGSYSLDVVQMSIFNNELHLQLGDRTYVVDPVTFTDICSYNQNYPLSPPLSDTWTPLYPAKNGYYSFTFTNSGVTAKFYSRTIGGLHNLEATFTVTQTSPLITIYSNSSGGGGARAVADPDNQFIWFVSARITDTNLNGSQADRIAARWDPVTNDVIYVNKPPVWWGQTYNTGHGLHVVNGTFVYGSYRSSQRLTTAVDIVSGSPVVKYFSGNFYLDGWNAPDATGYVRFSSTGKGFACDWNDSFSFYEFNMSTPSELPLANHWAAGSAAPRLGFGGQDTNVSPYRSIYPFDGGSSTDTWYYGSPVPANARVVSPPAYNRTPPVDLLATISPPAGQTMWATLSSDINLPYAGDNSWSSPRYILLEHDGLTSKLVTFLNPLDAATNAAYSGAIFLTIHAVLYTPEGRVIARAASLEPWWNMTAASVSYEEPSMYQWGFMLLSTMPPGNYYIGVLPYRNESYNGRTLFCDYEFDGYSADGSALTSGGVTQKFRVRVQTFAGAPYQLPG